MRGYWNRPEETRKTLRDGWLYTGDIAKMDEEGYFFIVDRKKDMILCSGYNVYPREIEEVLFQNPKVQEACALGVRTRTGRDRESLRGVEGRTDGDREEIIAYCRANLARYKVPTVVEFRMELPRSQVGKVLRKILREEENQKKA